ncbi:MAG: class I SAM-dependent methyltransferase [Chloroflexota bacterium]
MQKSVWWRLVKFGFRLLYNEMAFTYDMVSWLVSLGEWRSWQRAALKHLNVAQGGCVLEVAHGTANLQIDLRTAGLESIGMDFSPYMGAISRRKLSRHRIVSRLVRARAQTLPFPDAAFPAVVSTFPTDFIVDPATIAEVYRVLQPGGRLVFVPNGVLTGGGLARRGVDAAYRVTGQSGAWPIAITERFTAAGFTLTQISEPCRISVAQVIIAQKPN